MAAFSKTRFASKAEWAENKARELGIQSAQCRRQPNGGDWRKARSIEAEASMYEREAEKFRNIAKAMRRKGC